MADASNATDQDPHVPYRPPPDHPVLEFEKSAQRAMSEVIDYDVDEVLNKGRGSGVSPTDVTRSGVDLDLGGVNAEEEHMRNNGKRRQLLLKSDAE